VLFESAGQEVARIRKLDEGTCEAGLAMLIPVIEPLTRRNGLRLGQGYRISNPYPNPHDP
jgi:hypothetical protein